MSDSSAFIAGCATTGAAALILLLARLTLGEAPTQVEDFNATVAQESVIPVPAPPPGDSNLFTLPDELAEQQTLTKSLEEQIAQQKALLTELESQLVLQRQETDSLAARVEAYEGAINTLTLQQQQFAGVQQETDKAQSSLLWVGAGLVMVVLIGGALVLIILVVLVAFQSRSRPPATSQIIYPPDMPPPPPYYPEPYYPEQMLPPPRRTRRVYPQNIYEE